MPILAVDQNGQRIYLDRLKETTFGTANTSGPWVPTHYFNPLASFETPTPGIVVFNDREHATGTEYMGVQSPVRRGGKFTIPLPFTPEAFAWAMGYGVGDDTVSGSGPYIHTFAQPVPGTLMPAFSAEFHNLGATADASKDFRLLGCVLEGFDLTIPRAGWPQLDLMVANSGAYDNSALLSPTESSLIGPTPLIPGGKFRFSYANASTEGQSAFGGSITTPSGAGNFGANALTNVLTEHCDSIKLSVRNNPQGLDAAGVSSGAGTVGARPFFSDRTVTLDFTADSTTVTDDFDLALFNATQANNHESTFLLEFTSDVIPTGTQPYAGVVVLPLMALTAPPTRLGGRGSAKRSLSFEAKAIRAGTDYGAIKAYYYNNNSGVWGL